MRIQNAIFICALAAGISACEKVIEPGNLPEQEPRLVMNCIAYGNEPVTLTLSSSRSIVSGKDYVMLDKGRCDLFEDGRLIETMKNTGSGSYTSNHIARAGRKYRLEVSADSFDPVTAEANMPDSVPIISLDRTDTAGYDIHVFQQPGFYRNLGGGLRYTLVFRDDRARKNYYTVRSVVFLSDSLGQPLDVEAECSITHMNALSENQRYFGNTMEFSDEAIVDDLVKLDLVFNPYAELSHITGGVYVSLYVVFGHVSEEYYKYAKSVRDQLFNSGNPFSEPVQIYSNTSSKMGIFACISQGNMRQLYFGAPKNQ